MSRVIAAPTWFWHAAGSLSAQGRRGRGKRDGALMPAPGEVMECAVYL